jgi:hypothetical protein
MAISFDYFAKTVWRSFFGNEFVESCSHMLRAYVLLVITDGHVYGLVDESLNVCSAPAVTVLGYVVHSFLVNTAQLLHFLIQNCEENTLSLLDIWWRDINLEVEATSTQNGVINEVNTIRGSNNQYFLGGAKTVHFAQKLVDGCCSLMRIAKMVESITQRINFINEDDAAARRFSGCLEKLSYPP